MHPEYPAASDVVVTGETTHDQVTVEPSDPAPHLDEHYVTPNPVEAGSVHGEANKTVPATEPETVTAKTTSTTPRAAPTTTATTLSAASPSKSNAGVKSWFKTKFRSSSKPQKDMEKPKLANNTLGPTAGTTTIAEDAKVGSESDRDVAMAGRTSTSESNDMYGSAVDEPTSSVQDTTVPAARSRSTSISSLSSSETEGPARQQSTGTDVVEAESERRGRRGYEHRPSGRSAAVVASKQESDDDEDFEEARDTFEEEKLAPPPKLADVTKGSPVGSRERSKFTENL